MNRTITSGIIGASVLGGAVVGAGFVGSAGAYGGLVRIDHAVLTAGGILCIRTVHFNGIVFGGENDPQWTNVDGPERRRFLNPVIQNEGRTRALQQVVPNVPVANVVVCTGKVEFTTPPPANVIRVSELDSYIQKFVFGKPSSSAVPLSPM